MNAKYKYKQKCSMNDRNKEITKDVTETTGLEWSDFGLKEEILYGIKKKDFKFPSPVQEKAIPEILSGSDIIVRAKNGTGKTAAFLIPTLNLIDNKNKNIQAVILVPTRELAFQINYIIKEISEKLKIVSIICNGGTNLKEDIMRLKQGAHLVVGTPGRIFDLFNKNVCNLESCKKLILDEADKLISSDFLPIINGITNLLKKKFQMILFSATFPSEIASFIKKFPNMSKINLMKELCLKGISNYYVYLNEKQKVSALFNILKNLKINQLIIFCSSALRVELLSKKVYKFGLSNYYIHSKINQDIRNKIFHNFRSGIGKCLICTDLFTRGIDIPTINIVINFDFPETSETYLHRIGRGGRFGHRGIAINLITENNKEQLIKIENELKNKIEPLPEKIDESLY